MTSAEAPAAPAPAGAVTGLTVLYDEACPLCRAFRGWLAGQPQLVPLRFVLAGSPQAHRLFPGLDHAHTLREITVVGDDGAVWWGDRAWVMCLWALGNHRALAERLAQPGWLPVARMMATSAAGLRHLLVPARRDGGGGYPDGCDGSCAPLTQG